MLQFKTQPAERFSIIEQCQMVIEGGCAWIQLRLPDADESYIRELAQELIPLCKETSTIFMLEDRPSLAKELGLHGIHVTADSGLNAVQVREEFGPEAIIGTDVENYDAIKDLQNADIDYVTIPSSVLPEKRLSILEQARQADCTIPIVADGIFDIAKGVEAIKEGFSGICTGRYIVAAQDPVEYTERFIDSLRRCE